VVRANLVCLRSHHMGEAFILGAAAQISLLLSGLLATIATIPARIVGWLAAFSAGALFSAVAFDLVKQAEGLGSVGAVEWLLFGAVIFIAGDYAVDHWLGHSGDESTALAIVVGAIVDGIPESLIFGISLATGFGVSVAFLSAVVFSNIPQALAPSAELAAAGWSRIRLSLMWGAVVVACGLAATLGYLIGSHGGTGSRAAAVAAGGVLAMLTNSLLPFAYQRGGRLAGLWTVVGFVLALLPKG
jgi:ZIP family zinc transporter